MNRGQEIVIAVGGCPFTAADDGGSERGAAREGILPNRELGSAEGDVGELNTAVEGTHANACDRRGKLDGHQSLASAEGPLLKRGHGRGKGNRRKSGTVHKGSAAHHGYGVGDNYGTKVIASVEGARADAAQMLCSLMRYMDIK